MAIKFAIYGVGKKGDEVARRAKAKGMDLVAVIDPDAGAVGKASGKLMALERKRPTIVTRDDAQALRESSPKIVFHATGATGAKAAKQILECIKAGASVITLSKVPKSSEARINSAARARNVVVAGVESAAMAITIAPDLAKAAKKLK